MQGLHLHFDAPSGAAGDMALGALFDLGVPESVVRETLAGLGVAGFDLTVKKCLRRGMAGTDVKVLLDTPDDHHHDDPHDNHGHGHGHAHAHGHGHGHGHDHDHGHGHAASHPHRRHRDIVSLITARTSGRTRDLALAIFDRVAAAESILHGVPVADVSFHEVGAIDSIVDIVGTAAAVAWLAPRSVSASPLPLGHGFIHTSHGRLPVPSPAALEICRAASVPTYDGAIATELLTPTGAAILATLVETWGPAPPLRARAIGYGAGDADLADRPNLLRATVGEPLAAVPTEPLATATSDTLVELSANLDDMAPELCGHVADRLFASGAVDVWWTPVVMKKSRPAFILSVLAPTDRQAALIEIVFRETTTLGVRSHAVARRALERRVEAVGTPYGPIAVKVGLLDGAVVNAAPEYEACRAAATAHSVPLKEVYAAAIVAYRALRT